MFEHDIIQESNEYITLENAFSGVRIVCSDKEFKLLKHKYNLQKVDGSHYMIVKTFSRIEWLLRLCIENNKLTPYELSDIDDKLSYDFIIKYHDQSHPLNQSTWAEYNYDMLIWMDDVPERIYEQYIDKIDYVKLFTQHETLSTKLVS